MTRARVVYVDAWTMFANTTGAYTDYMMIDGNEVRVREDDGFHLTGEGSAVLAAKVNELIVAELKARGASIP